MPTLARQINECRGPNVTEGVEGSVANWKVCASSKEGSLVQLPLVEARSSKFSREIANLDFR